MAGKVIISHMTMKQNWKEEEMDYKKVSVLFVSPEETHTTFEVPSSQPSDSLAYSPNSQGHFRHIFVVGKYRLNIIC